MGSASCYKPLYPSLTYRWKVVCGWAVEDEVVDRMEGERLLDLGIR